MDYLKENLKLLIEKAATNPTQLSKATGVPQPTIKRILDGTSAESRSRTIAPIAEFFNISVEELRNKNLSEDYAKTWKAVSDGISQLHLAEPKTVFKSSAKIRPSVEVYETFFKNLREDLKKNADCQLTINGLSFRMDYHSEKLVVLMKSYSVGNQSLSEKGISYMSPAFLRNSLWLLSTLKLATINSHPDRKYFLFLTIVNEDHLPIPLNFISRMINEAGLHKINFVLSGAEDAAYFVSSFEAGNIHSFNEVGELISDDNSFL